MEFNFWIIFFSVIAVAIIFLLIKGKRLLSIFNSVDSSEKLFSTRKVTAYSVRPSRKTPYADSSFRVIITKSEFIIRPFVIDAHSERKSNLTHLVPLENIGGMHLEKTNKHFTTLYIVFLNKENEEMEIALISKKNAKIKELLEELRSSKQAG